MGYRHYLGVIDKDKLEELRNKDYFLIKNGIKDGLPQYDKMFQKIDNDTFWKIKESCKLEFCIGKLYYTNTDDIYDSLYNVCVRIIPEEIRDKEMFLPSQKIFFELANIYIQKAKNYYKKLIKPFIDLSKEGEIKIDFENLDKEKQKGLYKCVENIEHNYTRLNSFRENQKDLEISWDYELEAFNLMYFHKIFNPEKEVVICYAW